MLDGMTNIKASEVLKEIKYYTEDLPPYSPDEVAEALEMAIQALEAQPTDKGEISDGYHTFNQLYHQRAILFATIVNQNKDKAWKSFKHSDGKYCFDSDGEWFIVGVDTPQGSYTYHYAKEYWDMFDCQELECGKVWDGHTEEDVTRLLSLEQQPCEDCVSREAVETFKEELIDKLAYTGYTEEYKDEIIDIINQMPSIYPKRPKGKWTRDLRMWFTRFSCSNCGKFCDFDYLYCPNCGAEMSGGEEDEVND